MNTNEQTDQPATKIVFTHAGKEWTWHRPGDPMPCDGERKVSLVSRDGVVSYCERSVAASLNWTDSKHPYDIIGWRYADDVDPYAALKEAHAAGKVIEHRGRTVNGFWRDWRDAPDPQWHENGDTEYRIKPEPRELTPEEKLAALASESITWLSRGSEAGRCAGAVMRIINPPKGLGKPS